MKNIYQIRTIVGMSLIGIVLVGLFLLSCSFNKDSILVSNLENNRDNSKKIVIDKKYLKEVSTMKLSSPAFTQNSPIPSKYTCDGENINPPLEIIDLPTGTKSLVLIIDDPDIPAEIKKMRGIEVFDHWVVYNINPTTTKIAENSLLGAVGNGTFGKNSRGENKYSGPCPPSQYLPKEHRYFLKLYALDKMLDLAEGATKLEVETAMKGHILAQAELIGRYERNQ